MIVYQFFAYQQNKRKLIYLGYKWAFTALEPTIYT